MARAFEVILPAVHRHEGTINQFLGDGIVTLFGAPIAHEDHAQRALSAALARFPPTAAKAIRKSCRRWLDPGLRSVPPIDAAASCV